VAAMAMVVPTKVVITRMAVARVAAMAMVVPTRVITVTLVVTRTKNPADLIQVMPKSRDCCAKIAMT
ncbi:hypothetical protein, partial [Bifidobacterium ruminantium]|uniref:hypothetical protein n=1 Tax=Bifidobacterium ruminantium TaxID=78346 RepID=UPI000557F8EC